MTGIKLGKTYLPLSLVKVTDKFHGISYYAVDDDTCDNMLNVDYSRMHNESLRYTKVEYLGDVLVQQKEDDSNE